MKTKLRLIILCAAVFAASFSAAGAIFKHEQPITTSDTHINIQSNIPAAAVSYQQNETYYYTVGEYCGSVAVFFGSDPSPALVTSIDTFKLRDCDRELLCSGIKLSSHDEVLKLLEDLGS